LLKSDFSFSILKPDIHPPTTKTVCFYLPAVLQAVLYFFHRLFSLISFSHSNEAASGSKIIKNVIVVEESTNNLILQSLNLKKFET